MKKFKLLLLVAGLGLLAVATDSSGRGGRGGGGGGGGGRGGGGGGARPSGGFTAPARPQAAARPAAPAPRSAAGAPRASATSSGHVATRPAGGSSGVGPGGGSYQTGSRGGSYTTQGGSTITYKGAGIGGTTGGGVSGGRYVGGVQVTTPGGQTINKASRGSVAQGPGGNTAAKKGSVGNTYGAYGSGAAASRSAAVSGPGGTAAARAGVATGPGGTAAARTGVAATSRGTYYRSAAAVSGQGYAVRQNFSNFAQQYPGLALRWAGPTFRPITWAALASYGGYPSESTSYDYGSSVAYQDDGVYVNGENVGTPEEYAQQATEIADAGKQAEEPPKEEFMPLGVFAMVQGEETNSSNIFQLAVSKTGVVRGEYYNALTDTTEPVFGSVDKKTQRAAWTVGDKKAPVYEAGIINLTGEQTTMMVHYSKDKSQQFTLFRIEKPKEGEAEQAGSGK